MCVWCLLLVLKGMWRRDLPGYMRNLPDLSDSRYGPIHHRACAWCGATHFHTMEDTCVDETRRRSCDIKRLLPELAFPEEKTTPSSSSLETYWWNSTLSITDAKHLLGEGASPHVSRGGRSLLCHLLARAGSGEIPDLLLDHGARFDRCDIDMSPLPAAPLLCRPTGRPPLGPFYQASSLVQWQAYLVYSRRPTLQRCIDTGILDGSDDESLALPAYFESLLVHWNTPRLDIAEVAQTVALLLRYTYATIDTRVYPHDS